MWRSVCCEIQGQGHKKNGIPCQDKTLYIHRKGIHVIALADGAGSAKFSHYGADCVIHSIADFIIDNFQKCIDNDDGKKIKQIILNKVSSSLTQEAQKRKCSVHDLSSTLLLAAVNSHNFILVHIGDGVIGYLDNEGLKVASIPDNGEFTNQTTFVTSNNALAKMRIFKGSINNKAGFVLMSDGTEQSLYNKRSKTLADVIVKIMYRTCVLSPVVIQNQVQNALDSVISQNTQDDCSIAVLARLFPPLIQVEDLPREYRKRLYGITDRQPRRLINYYDTILRLTETPHSIQYIARRIHLKPKYAGRYVQKLIDSGLIVKNNGLYQHANTF